MNDIRIKKISKKSASPFTKETKDGRRKFIKTLAYGSGALVVGGVLAKSESLLSLTKSAGNKFSNFRLVDRGNEVALHDKNGDEILIVEKNS